MCQFRPAHDRIGAKILVTKDLLYDKKNQLGIRFQLLLFPKTSNYLH